MGSEGKPMTGPMIIEKDKSSHDKMKITYKDILWQQLIKKLPVRTQVTVVIVW